MRGIREIFSFAGLANEVCEGIHGGFDAEYILLHFLKVGKDLGDAQIRVSPVLYRSVIRERFMERIVRGVRTSWQSLEANSLPRCRLLNAF